MGDSKILIAIRKYAAEYAWDKSLVVVPKPAPFALPATSEAGVFDPLERFQEMSNHARIKE
jgi:hypothetical protein